MVDEARERRLDRKWSKAILFRAKYICEVCGSIAVDPHHIFKRGCTNTRWDPDNGCAVCRVCHREFENSAKYNREYFKNVMGSLFDIVEQRSKKLLYQINDDIYDGFETRLDEILACTDIEQPKLVNTSFDLIPKPTTYF